MTLHELAEFKCNRYRIVFRKRERAATSEKEGERESDRERDQTEVKEHGSKCRQPKEE